MPANERLYFQEHAFYVLGLYTQENIIAFLRYFAGGRRHEPEFFAAFRFSTLGSEQRIEFAGPAPEIDLAMALPILPYPIMPILICKHPEKRV